MQINKINKNIEVFEDKKERTYDLCKITEKETAAATAIKTLL